jgi:hypothetical protein
LFLVGYQDGGIRYRPAFFYWILWKRLTELILGYAGMIFILSGVIALMKNTVRNWRFIILLIIGVICYVVVFAEGNVRHDYYQVITLPVIVLVAGIGIDYALTIAKKFRIIKIGVVVIIFCIALTFYFSWNKVKTYYWINNYSIIEAGKSADELLPVTAKVIAPYGGDTAFLYQTNRQGWPIGFTIEDKIKLGATHYVSVDPNDPEAVDLALRYPVLKKTDSYIIIQLTP